MTINANQISTGPTLFQGLQSGPRPQASPVDEATSSRTQTETAVKASAKSERPSEQAAENRDSPRGSLVDLKA